MRYPAIYSSADRSIGPYPDPLHGQEVEDLIRAADLCEGAVPSQPVASAEAMLVAIEDHLGQGQLLYAIQHQAELSMLAGSMHRLGYAEPETAPHEAIEEVQHLADQGELAIEQWLRLRGLDGM
jgi:hypothetical protein